MKSAADYRIENIRNINLNGRLVTAFDALVKEGDAFVFCGAYTAPAKTAKKDLWLVPNESDTGSAE